jgi:RNA-splicing ligase RtcB
MRVGIIIAIGKCNEDWNKSSPHGAGRLMGRNEAKRQLSMSEFTETMNGIYSTTVNNSTLDEAPMAYKPMQEIIDNIQDTVNIDKIIKPIYNFKASE